MATTVQISKTFWNDHADRCPLDEGEELAKPIGSTSTRVTFAVDDPGLAHLYADALFYADRDSMDECPAHIQASASRTVKALEKAGLK